MDVGNSGMGVRSVIPDVGNNSVGVLMESGSNSLICIYCKFSLEVEN